MPLDETIETFNYFLGEADKLDLAFICLMKCIPLHEVIIDGKCPPPKKITRSRPIRAIQANRAKFPTILLPPIAP